LDATTACSGPFWTIVETGSSAAVARVELAALARLAELREVRGDDGVLRGAPAMTVWSGSSGDGLFRCRRTSA
jgi:hypothetical protein